MEAQALEIASWGKNVYVKIPITNTQRASAVPLVNEARDWAHGVFMASNVASEGTAAAENAIGELREQLQRGHLAAPAKLAQAVHHRVEVLAVELVDGDKGSLAVARREAARGDDSVD